MSLLPALFRTLVEFYLRNPQPRRGWERPREPRPRPPARLIVPYARMTDEQWEALAPVLAHFLSDTGRGRPCDLRAHFDAFFRVAATEGSWRELPEEFGKPDTVSRHFRRLTHTGLWEKLLLLLPKLPGDHILSSLEGYICRAARRAIRLRGLRIILIARRLKLLRALPGPPWMCPDPDLSETIKTLPIREKLLAGGEAARGYSRYLRHLLTLAGGQRYIPRAVKESWV